MNIQQTELKSQYLKIKDELNIAISEVLESGVFIQGTKIQSLELALASRLKIPYCITCGNGTDAIQIALMALGLKPGDEVIVPAFTYVASVEAVALLGLKPVFTDIDASAFSISLDLIQDKITSKTKVILPVHLFGQSVPIEEIIKISSKKGIHVIEDAAQAIGAEYQFSSGETKYLGTIGSIGITSFFPSKNLGCYGDGGALFTQSEELAKKIRMIANHGQERKYYHDIIGINSRLDTIQAAILSIKLKYLDQYTQARQKAAAYYDQAFAGNPWFDIPYRHPSSTHVFHQYTIKVKSGKRDALKSFLESKGIPSMIYYPVPVHLQKAYAYLGYKKGDFPVAERLCEEVLSLPMHTELTEEQLDYICANVLSFFNNK